MRAIADAEKMRTVRYGTIRWSHVRRNVAAYAGFIRVLFVVVRPVYCTQSVIISTSPTPNTPSLTWAGLCFGFHNSSFARIPFPTNGR